MSYYNNKIPNDITIVVVQGLNNERLDVLLSKSEFKIPRSHASRLIEAGRVLVNDSPPNKNYKSKIDDKILIKKDPTQKEAEPKSDPEPKPENSENKYELLNGIVDPIEMDIKIVYEDDHILVVDKEAGISVHPSVTPIKPKNTKNNNNKNIEEPEKEKCLVNGLVHKYGSDKLSNFEGTLRPGIVHRLDKETSGLIIICKNNEVHKLLKEKFENKTISKKYWTIVYGKLPNTEGVIEEPIGRHPKIGYKMVVDKVKGKPAKTSYKQLQQWRLKNGSYYTMLEIDLHTGRTHQIRVHLSSKACSVVSDPIYSHKSEKFHPDHLCLVSKQLSFVHPIMNNEIKLEVDLPKHMQDFIDYLNKNEVKL